MLRALLRFCDRIRRRLTLPPSSATLPERLPLPGPLDPETQRHLLRVHDETLARVTFGLG
jgi:hypothetical protein